MCLIKLKQFENDKIINDVRYYDISPLKEFDSSNRLGNTKFISIEKECFKELPNLEIIFFNHNNLAKIVTNSFQHLNKLKKLELEQNQVEQIDSNGFKGLENLEELNFNFNKLIKIETNSFIHLSKLKKLNIGMNLIEQIKFNFTSFRIKYS